jgi:hypothetical protein
MTEHLGKLGKYQILGIIGRGGMGTVYRAFDPVLSRPVALKVVSSEGELSTEQKARLLREGKACAQLTHPNIISIHDLGEDGDRIFIVMELLEGEDLKQGAASAEPRALQPRISPIGIVRLPRRLRRTASGVQCAPMLARRHPSWDHPARKIYPKIVRPHELDVSRHRQNAAIWRVARDRRGRREGRGDPRKQRQHAAEHEHTDERHEADDQ